MPEISPVYEELKDGVVERADTDRELSTAWDGTTEDEELNREMNVVSWELSDSWVLDDSRELELVTAVPDDTVAAKIDTVDMETDCVSKPTGDEPEPDKKDAVRDEVWEIGFAYAVDEDWARYELEGVAGLDDRLPDVKLNICD